MLIPVLRRVLRDALLAGGKLALWGAIVALIVFVIAVLGGMFFL